MVILKALLTAHKKTGVTKGPEALDHAGLLL